MKRIVLLILALTCAMTAAAQYADGPVHRKGTHLVSGKEVLTKEQAATLLADIDGEDYSDDWESAAGRRKLGMGLTIGGSVATVGGAVLLLGGVGVSMLGAIFGSIGGKESAEEGAKAGTPAATAGLIVGLAGIGSVCAGVPILVSSNKKMNRIVVQYNNIHTQPSVAFGPTPNGVGFQLIF